jgi:hypothetical protein
MDEFDPADTVAALSHWYTSDQSNPAIPAVVADELIANCRTEPVVFSVRRLESVRGEFNTEVVAFLPRVTPSFVGERLPCNASDSQLFRDHPGSVWLVTHARPIPGPERPFAWLLYGSAELAASPLADSGLPARFARYEFEGADGLVLYCDPGASVPRLGAHIPRLELALGEPNGSFVLLDVSIRRVGFCVYNHRPYLRVECRYRGHERLLPNRTAVSVTPV